MEKSPEVATAVPYNHEKGKYLLMKRSGERNINPGKWEFPSGHIRKTDDSESISEGNADGHTQRNESPRNAALRELEEETGLKGTLLKSGKPFTTETEDGIYRVHPFLVKIDGQPEISREHEKYDWIRPEELEKYDTVEDLRKDLKQVGALD
jgi:8-oxo-dGTP pyrophosphatase MutT (NUDIX family)